MKRNAMFAVAMFAAGSLMAADVKDDVSGAVKALKDTGNYSWTQDVENANGGGFGNGPSQGKTKDGLIYTSRDFNGNTFEILVNTKSTNAAMNNGQDGWQTEEEMAANNGGGGGGGGFRRGGFARFIRTPDVTAADTLKDVSSLKQDGDAYVGDLTDEGAKTLASPFGRRGGRGGGGGGNFTPPEVTDAKGTAKFWIKDGKLSRYTFHVTGKSTDRDGNPVDIDRTTTVDIKDIGSTKIDAPADIVKKIGG